MGEGTPRVAVTCLAAWAPRRLQYGSQAAWQVELGQELRELLLRPSPSGFLFARLSSDDQGADLENLLFYNVGLLPLKRIWVVVPQES